MLKVTACATEVNENSPVLNRYVKIIIEPK